MSEVAIHISNHTIHKRDRGLVVVGASSRLGELGDGLGAPCPLSFQKSLILLQQVLSQAAVLCRGFLGSRQLSCMSMATILAAFGIRMCCHHDLQLIEICSWSRAPLQFVEVYGTYRALCSIRYIESPVPRPAGDSLDGADPLDAELAAEREEARRRRSAKLAGFQELKVTGFKV